MIDHKQKSTKKNKPGITNDFDEKFDAIKKAGLKYGLNLTYDPGLNKFSGDEYIPEKHKEDEIRLANSILPGRSSSLK